MSWILRDGIAQLQWNGWSAQANLSAEHPCFEVGSANKKIASQTGKVVVKPHDADAPDSNVALPLGDAYVRRQDLVALYPEKSPARFAYQLDFRVIDFHETSTLIVEFWLSVQTSTLEARPKLNIIFENFVFENSDFEVARDPSHQVGIMVHPLDHLDCKMIRTADPNQSSRIEAFGRFMEKGVIRRARFRAVFADRRWSDMQWNEAFQEFVESPLPLTT